MEDRMQVGAWGEHRATTYLVENGFTILARNWRFKNRHEIDIVATKDDELVAIEVKTHAYPQETMPFEQVTKSKSRQITQALEIFAKEHNAHNMPLRIDVISIIRHPFSLEYFKSADFTL
ncbi:YraN family protein [bacterium]|uniref:UPF0102 protein CO179_05015 n=2 Tax=Katanobacteria TaxID=422282 RepID=A0A2M7X0E0_UNCKA|nr:YraN family protein [bacterium]PIP56880.1 MAG: endonuclease [candidate division WWE3 bacterium CG22_combo_CG10-13_8_21_14_all_39_12]PJA39521.1 MAG: endonuclease [candidate division WWE3 bacterium CG_4_9_14_3_um_filter_39_7]